MFFDCIESRCSISISNIFAFFIDNFDNKILRRVFYKLSRDVVVTCSRDPELSSNYGVFRLAFVAFVK